MENKEELLKQVKQYIDRAGDLLPDGADENERKQGKQKLNGILDGADAEKTEKVNEIRAFEQEGEVESGKLYTFCMGGFTQERLNCSADKACGGAEVQNAVFISDAGADENIQTENNRYLDDDELEKLYRFVKAHKSDKTFGSAVNEIMKKHGMEAPQVYRQAMLSRQDFSRVTGPKCKGVKKTTVWSLIIGLHCDIDEANYLLYSAGISKKATVFDLILEFMVIHKNYDVMAINEVLYDYNQTLLACHKDYNDKM